MNRVDGIERDGWRVTLTDLAAAYHIPADMILTEAVRFEPGKDAMLVYESLYGFYVVGRLNPQNGTVMMSDGTEIQAKRSGASVTGVDQSASTEIRPSVMHAMQDGVADAGPRPPNGDSPPSTVRRANK